MKKIISGKVRDVYEITEETLLIVTTDRISAFDVVLPTPIENKGRVLSKLASFWFGLTGEIIPNHMISDRAEDFPPEFRTPEFEGRTVLVRRLKMLPFEFIVRGYIFGNMWSAYESAGEFCGYKLKEGYRLADKLETPILTPSTKSADGHDVYISFARLESEIGAELAGRLNAVCLRLYEKCLSHARSRGIIIADTKFEFGFDKSGALVLADEIFTPDSSRFWDAESYAPGSSPKSYDKQFVRDWLIENRKDGAVPPPQIPEDIALKTSEKYAECLFRLTGEKL